MKAYLYNGKVVFVPLRGSTPLGDAVEVKPVFNASTHRLQVRSATVESGSAKVVFEAVPLSAAQLAKISAKEKIRGKKLKKLSANEVAEIVEALVELQPD